MQCLQSDALAHRGFLARSRRIPIEALYAHARGQGKRLVLCGMFLSSQILRLGLLQLGMQRLPMFLPSMITIPSLAALSSW